MPAPVLGRLADTPALVGANALDRLIVALPLASHHRILEIVAACDRLPVEIQFVPDLFEIMTQRVRVSEIDGIPLLALRAYPLEAWNRAAKRTFDIALSATFLVVSTPLMAIVALLVRADSPGPILFRQRRVGRDGREFTMLKFRSMPVDAERDSGPVIGDAVDPRATPLGRFLRRTCLDELPQLWNVLAGEMSLVGPRPERPVFVEQFDREVPRYFARHRVKSGVTGWAQVNGLRGKTSIDERTKYDIFYVENWSVVFDLKILFLTARQILFANRPDSAERA
jgi:exopolysaccharide biosynthesis polyprenyl glycosylphosphotransferase